ncbi:MAG: glycosyltransferase family 2 protein [Candidatus Moranbacteria bacterium]|nr:glycosyltransferase family 2 protein [bacterium]MDP1834120.1 glycosyltransferase family 2 protein [Candidatus Moranbacteria bacterium]
MQDTNPYLSVIIPAYNEGGRKGEELKNNLREIGEYLGGKNISYEVVVVNDGSKDNTAEFVKGLAHLVAKLEVIDRQENRGKFFSVREGFMAAKGKYRLLTDADGATSITNLENFLDRMEKGEDVLIGSRDLKESNIKKHQPKWKELMGDAGNLLIQFMLGLRGLEDTQCGFKVISARAVSDIVPQMQVDRWGGDFEMLMLAKKMGYEIVEVPVTWLDAGQTLVGASGMGGYASTLKELLQVKWRMITGQYKYKK